MPATRPCPRSASRSGPCPRSVHAGPTKSSGLRRPEIPRKIMPPREILNVPAGNSEISAEPRVLTDADRRTGDTKEDLVKAFKVSLRSPVTGQRSCTCWNFQRIRPIEDLKSTLFLFSQLA